MLNASYHAPIWGSAPLTRHLPKEWGSDFVCKRICSSRTLPAHTPAYDRKKRCSGVNPSTTPKGASLVAFLNAWKETCKPPWSAIFSPKVREPFAYNPGNTWMLSKKFTITWARLLKRSASSGVHQSFKLPSLSNWRPWSSNPWVISCPITTPIAP